MTFMEEVGKPELGGGKEQYLIYSVGYMNLFSYMKLSTDSSALEGFYSLLGQLDSHTM